MLTIPVRKGLTQDIDLYARFKDSFRAVIADTPALVGHALALRYQVYCVERHFEDPQAHPDGLERDALDASSIHTLLLFSGEAEPIGTARLILPLPGAELPIENLLRQIAPAYQAEFPVESTGEVSRFLISKSHRQRAVNIARSERMAGGSDLYTFLPCLGLVQALLRASVAVGTTHWAAVMEPKLLRLLAALGIHFHSVGPLVSHHGIRQPSYCGLEEMLAQLLQEKPAHWAIVTDDGRLWS